MHNTCGDSVPASRGRPDQEPTMPSTGRAHSCCGPPDRPHPPLLDALLVRALPQAVGDQLLTVPSRRREQRDRGALLIPAGALTAFMRAPPAGPHLIPMGPQRPLILMPSRGGAGEEGHRISACEIWGDPSTQSATASSHCSL